MKYRAKVLTPTMNVQFMEIEAATDEEALHFVEVSGANVLDLKRLRAGLAERFRRRSFNLVVFNQQLHTLLDAGQPIVDAIAVLGRNDSQGRHKAIFESLLQSLQRGKQLSDAMASIPSVFPPLYVAMVRSSETTGTVQASIRRFLQYQGQAAEIRGKLVAAAIYPAILVAVALVVIAFLMLYVVPRFSIVFDDVGAARHASAGFVQLWGGFVRRHYLLAWSGVLGGLAAVITLGIHPGLRQALFRKVLTTPWIGERVWILQLARLYRTLSMLLHSGISVLGAMKLTEASLPESMRQDLLRAAQAVSEGKPMSMSMQENRLSTEVAQRLLVAGESSGMLDKMMDKIADFYDQETSAWIDAAGRLLEPALMVGIGLVIGAIVLMLYAPIFDLANAV